jgi:hypothetical protein
MKEFEKKRSSSSENSHLGEEDKYYFKKTSANFLKLMTFNEQ